MEDLGLYLRKLREGKGISYQKVFDDLRIREGQVRLIEENSFFALGPFGMARAMVHKYAGYLEADMGAVMAELKVMLPDQAQTEFKPKETVREKKILLSPNFFWLIGIILFVAFLGAILWHAYTQGWLKTPQIFRAEAPDTTQTVAQPKEKPQPDPIRQRQRQISEAVGRSGTGQASQSTNEQQAVSDSTDYLGELLGPSQVNVPLH